MGGGGYGVVSGDAGGGVTVLVWLAVTVVLAVVRVLVVMVWLLVETMVAVAIKAE